MKKLFLQIITLTTVLFVIKTQAQIINIPGDYPTIQQGINAATDNDTVLVQPDTYYENINLFINSI